ncbi:type I phosphomannose isomerase catalytic subunit [Planctomyces sp. SH-PL62]|uniref:type I phosphomannose isomerase catalytic subunit n=1 Tax=Planctomyces sp. SH-PL62 TaxID=1636152 RepID=UPI00078BC316|nr:type I phosphomannose isomerase catalytic subunit [Planctomyces sp. SH-PL62]AMV38512.1 Putative mannose-6-phosphate isomerase YvyI [Planctomyces sp. SH-PL62]
MQPPPLEPLAFTPILRRLVWGGRRLGTVLGKPIGDGDDYAESWEIADYHDAVSVVRDGPLAGTTLRDLVENRPAELFGRGRAEAQFPLLVKLLDAREPLSVQVHPDDALGRELAGDRGKTEAWVVLAADPGSRIYAGLKAGVGREDLERAIREGAVEPLLHQFEPRPGDCVLVEAGTVHAIGAGVLLAEIQQTSDATFRVFDWNRVDAAGKPRDLHVDQALRSIDFGRGPVDPIVPAPLVLEDGDVREPLVRCRYFELERWTIEAPAEIGRDDRFTILMVLDGEVRARGPRGDLTFRKGETVLLPATIGPTMIIPVGRAVVLACQQP